MNFKQLLYIGVLACIFVNLACALFSGFANFRTPDLEFQDLATLWFWNECEVQIVLMIGTYSMVVQVKE